LGELVWVKEGGREELSSIFCSEFETGDVGEVDVRSPSLPPFRGAVRMSDTEGGRVSVGVFSGAERWQELKAEVRSIPSIEEAEESDVVLEVGTTGEFFAECLPPFPLSVCLGRLVFEWEPVASFSSLFFRDGLEGGVGESQGWREFWSGKGPKGKEEEESSYKYGLRSSSPPRGRKEFLPEKGL
jgi:hypothetical protein